MRLYRIVAGALLGGAAILSPCSALDKPTGAPLVMSDVETEQPIPLAVLSPDGKMVTCSRIRLHWSPTSSVTSQDDTISFTIDLAADKPGAPIFTAQLWSASLASSLAWQKPWEGAHWKVFDVPNTDGTGMDAALAVGMIATSARRPYPKDTLVIGNLHPDSSLGAVSRLADRLDAAAKAGITRVIIPNVQQFETDSSGQLVNILRHASDLHLECIPVNNIIDATQVAMNDPLPDPPALPPDTKYNADVASYIDGFAQKEEGEVASGLTFAPKEDQLSQYPPHQAAVWKQVYAEIKGGRAAYKDGQVYVAYRLLARANSRMRGMNALAGQDLTNFDVKAALSASQDLQQRLQHLMAAPDIDRAELQSAMLIAEMADWAYDIEALLEGSQLVTKQTFSQRSDATGAERDRAREMILSANQEAEYLLNGADFYTGLLSHLGDVNPLPANTNAQNLLPQLIPAQLATAQIFTDGIRPQANELRVGLLFDPRLAAYVKVLREEKAAWDSRQRRKADSVATAAATPATPPASDTSTNAPSVTLASTNNGPVGFDPGNNYAPPHNEVDTAEPQQKLSEVAQCLEWVNTDCEIAALDAKYLRLNGSVDPLTREWRLKPKDRSQLEALLQLAESGAREGVAFAGQAQVDPSIFSMIMERASYLRLHGDDSSALDGLRNYWRCALLGNMCWQLAHTHKAAVVDLSAETPDKGRKSSDKKLADKDKAKEKVQGGDKSDAGAQASDDSGSAEKPAPKPEIVDVSGKVPPDTNTVNVPTPPAISNRDKVMPVETAPTNVVDVSSAPPADQTPAPASVATPVASAEGSENTPPPPVPAPQAVNLPSPAPSSIPPVGTNAPAAGDEHAFPRALPVDISTNSASSDVGASPAPTTPTAAPAPVATPVPKDDEYTGGESGTAPPVAKPVDPAELTNTAPANP